MYKVIDSYAYNRKDGKPEYVVEISSKYGNFIASASPCDSDIEWTTQWTGYRLAEYKCYIQLLKKKSLVMRERANGIKHALAVLTEKYNSYSMPLTNDYIFLDNLEHQYHIAKREYEKVRNMYEHLKQRYDSFVESRIAAEKAARKYIDRKREQANQQIEQ